MKLTYFSIRDYRSIAKAELENLQSAAILIGPNNEGKSNVLQGLNACLSLLREPDLRRINGEIQLVYDRESFDWATDYPISKQLKHKDGESVFQLHFQLSDSEKAAFQTATASKLNSVLPIELSFGAGRLASFKVLKQGKGGAALTKKPAEICKFVASTLDFAYIPAVRTANASLDVVNGLVSRELRQLEKNPRYAELLVELEGLQKPILETIADKLADNLRGFLGKGLKDVSLTLADRHRFQRFGKACQITIDDGTPTLLERKGDGVQSLVAISLMTGALQETGADKDIILLLEEPESHLHPNAIHQLREVLDTMREDNQLIVTTHCPLLVNRANVPSNLIVSKNKASPAKSLKELRDVLGVRASDNLQHAALVVVVEGPEDEVALRALLAHYSPTLGAALVKGSLTFHALGGASKLPYALSLLQSSLCNYYTFIDDDEEGRKGYAEAAKSLLASTANTTSTKCLGLPEAEFEDLLKADVYAEYFKTKYFVDVKHRPFDEKLKWSKRIRFGLTKSGKTSPGGEVWPEKDEYDDKRAIAELVVKSPSTAIHPAREEVLKAFVSSLEAKLAALSAGKST
jgi:putative ATP-dependent endonuclease of OLD family